MDLLNERATEDGGVDPPGVIAGVVELDDGLFAMIDGRYVPIHQHDDPLERAEREHDAAFEAAETEGDWWERQQRVRRAFRRLPSITREERDRLRRAWAARRAGAASDARVRSTVASAKTGSTDRSSPPRPRAPRTRRPARARPAAADVDAPGAPATHTASIAQRSGAASSGAPCLPVHLTADEVAELLRTSRKAIYAMAERGQLPGVIRLGRRLLVDRDDLLRWLDERRAPSPGRTRR